MNNLAAGIGGAVAVVVIGASAIVFANRSTGDGDSTQVAAANTSHTGSHTECTQEKVVTNKEWGAKSVVGTLLGGAAGGALGHQIGGGHGKDAATAVGAVGGAYVGHEVANKNFPDQQVSYRENCRNVPG
ncbi:MAG: glycine zipper protein [Hydrocarboniphaga sp.]|uniref:glycine zipper 2TM domain-containing protein n=1 Tax=Hydrocarboniphaga sp. TaxID=2033016 RepID=UPI002619046D|nr:glycine zipper 2TM domain-containing protein [Hydrocarboniphaga sp.]MDB5968432.1 glycine zipper protein [Hydrocarboniphaga sp.]